MPTYGDPVNVSRMFHEGTHVVEYKAVDDAGNFGRCTFSVVVNGRIELKVLINRH